MGPSFLGYYENSVLNGGICVRSVSCLLWLLVPSIPFKSMHASTEGGGGFFCFLVGRPLELFFLQAQTAEAVYLHGKNALVSYPIPPMHTIKELPIPGESLPSGCGIRVDR